MNTTNLFALFSALALSACTTDGGNFGEAVNRNVLTQIANPKAPNPNTPSAMDGRRAALGQDRYVLGKVTQPAMISTQTQGSSGGGGSGASSSGSSD